MDVGIERVKLEKLIKQKPIKIVGRERERGTYQRSNGCLVFMTSCEGGLRERLTRVLASEIEKERENQTKEGLQIQNDVVSS